MYDSNIHPVIRVVHEVTYNSIYVIWLIYKRLNLKMEYNAYGNYFYFYFFGKLNNLGAFILMYYKSFK